MILFTFSRCCDPSLYSITPISAAGIIDEDWEKNCVLIVFPGGAANPYHRKLSELCGNSGNARIKEFVRNGGNYLGFCAGAYYGCHSIEFDKARSLEVVCNYELGFFDGKAWALPGGLRLHGRRAAPMPRASSLRRGRSASRA